MFMLHLLIILWGFSFRFAIVNDVLSFLSEEGVPLELLKK